ncbi:MAG: TadE family protein [Planctomycetota bacterium]
MLSHHLANNSRSKVRRIRGAAVVELVVSIPLILLLAFAVIELTSLIFVKQSLSIAAYEAAHRAVQPVATAEDAIQIANDILQQRRIQGAVVTVSPNDLSSVPVGDLFTVRITAPSDINSIGFARFIQPATLASDVVVMKEFE